MRICFLNLLLVFFCSQAWSAEPNSWGDAILLRATFDKGADANQAKGDKRIYTAESLARKTVKAGLLGDSVVLSPDGGRKGGALHFAKPTKQLVFFKGGKNVPYRKTDFEGTVSMWMRLSPAEDLPKGYVDPLQITDKKWNDASFFVDFDENKERDFRLGAFADYKSWNPTDRKFEEIPVKERPMVVVEKPPFTRDKWTHVAFTWSNLNGAKQPSAVLYLDGESQGTIGRPMQFTWKPEDVVIMLGINYVGWIDDLIILDRALSPADVKMLTGMGRKQCRNALPSSICCTGRSDIDPPKREG